VETEYGPVVPLQGLAVSVGFFAAVYPFENTALTYVRPDTGLPAWTEKVIDEQVEDGETYSKEKKLKRQLESK
jgi:hypothetical protein